MDDAIHKGKLDKKYNRAVNNKNKMTKSQYDILMKVERQAWDQGETIAKLLDIPLGKWYYLDKKSH